MPGAAGAMPLVESDYLASSQEHFTVTDSNHNGMIEAKEAEAAFVTVELLPNETARAACSKVKRNFAAEYNPGSDPAYKPMTKQQYLDFRKAMFDRIDADHDHVIMQSEMDDYSARMIAECTAMLPRGVHGK